MRAGTCAVIVLEASQMFMMIDCVRNDVCGEVLYVC